MTRFPTRLLALTWILPWLIGMDLAFCDTGARQQPMTLEGDCDAAARQARPGPEPRMAGAAASAVTGSSPPRWVRHTLFALAFLFLAVLQTFDRHGPRDRFPDAAGVPANIDDVQAYSILTLDTKGTVTSWNRGAEQQKGYRAAEIVGSNFVVFFTDQDRAAGLPELLLAGAERTGEIRAEGWRVRKDGSRFWSLITISALRNPDGSLQGFTKITLDITERRQAQDRLLAVFESVGNALVMADVEGRIALVNIDTEELFGQARHELTGRPAELLIAGRYRDEFAAACELTRFRDPDWLEEPYRDWFCKRDDGVEFPAKVRLRRIRMQDGDHLLISIEDLTRFRRDQQRLQNQAALLDLASDAILVCDARHRVIFWNRAAEQLYGWSAAEALGSVSHELLETRFPEPLEEIQERFENSGVWRGEMTHSARDGRLVTVAGSWSLQSNANGGPGVILELHYDITRQKLDQEELRAARNALERRVAELDSVNLQLKRKNEDVEAFVYIVTHDFRAPLVNLQGFCKELEFSTQELHDRWKAGTLEGEGVGRIFETDIPESLRYMQASSDKLHRLINALLDLSRHGRETYRMGSLDVSSLLRASIAALQTQLIETGGEIAYDKDRIPLAHGDATAIGQVLTNLLQNALKYRHPERAPRIEVGGETDAAYSHFWVRDNGAGWPAACTPRLFQVFQRFHPKTAPGEGMGLATAKRIVERHGGRIWAESVEGTGSTFHFTLPTHGRESLPEEKS